MSSCAEWKTRKNMRKGAAVVEPLYGEKDVDETLKLLAPLPPCVFKARDGARADAGPGLKVLRRDARQGRAAHRVALPLPRLARDAEHGGFARTGS